MYNTHVHIHSHMHTYTTHTHIHLLSTHTHTHLLSTHTHIHLLSTHANIDWIFSQFLMPGLVDCHAHPEQLVNAGTGYNKVFLDWAFQVFFPALQVFDNNQTYARNAASLMVVCNFMLHNQLG